MCSRGRIARRFTISRELFNGIAPRYSSSRTRRMHRCGADRAFGNFIECLSTSPSLNTSLSAATRDATLLNASRRWAHIRNTKLPKPSRRKFPRLRAVYRRRGHHGRVRIPGRRSLMRRLSRSSSIISRGSCGKVIANSPLALSSYAPTSGRGSFPRCGGLLILTCCPRRPALSTWAV